jgi:hypothetical protein
MQVIGVREHGGNGKHVLRTAVLPWITILLALGLIAAGTVFVGVPSARPSAASTLTQPSVSLSATEAAASDVVYTVEFSTSANGAIPAGGTITMVAPPGTLWPSNHNACDYVLTDLTTASGDASCPSVKFADSGLPVYDFLSYSGAAVSLTVPNAISARDQLSLAISGVVNPGAGTQTLTVLTSSDTTPVISAPYTVTVSSSVTQPSVTLSSSAAGATAVDYTVGFTTSANGAIPAGGTITVVGPPGMVWPNSCSYALSDLTTPGGGFTGPPYDCAAVSLGQPGLPIYKNCCSGSSWGSAVSITVPNAIKAGDVLSLSIMGAVNPGAGTQTLTVATSSDSDPVTSSSYTISPASSVTQPAVTLSSDAAGATSVDYTVGFTTSATGAIPAGGSITVIGPPGTTWPGGSGTCGAYVVTDVTTSSGDSTACNFGGLSSDVADDGAAATLTLPHAVNAGDSVSVAISGVTNPGAGSQTLDVSTSADPTMVASVPYAVSGDPASLSSVTAPTLTTSGAAGGANGVTYTLGFTTSSTGTLVGGSSTVTVVAPSGTIFGTCPFGCGSGNPTFTFTDLTNPSGSGSGSPAAVIGDSSVVSVAVPNTIQAGDSVTLTITQVTNPPAGAGSLALSTSADADPATITDPTTTSNSVASASLSTSTSAAGANGVTYTVGFTASSSGTLLGGLSAVTLAAPSGTIFGGCPYGCGGGNATYTFTDLTNPSASGSASPEAIVGDNSLVSVAVPNTIQAGDSVTLTITQVTNPPAGTLGLAFSTSSDTTPVILADSTTAPNSVTSVSLSPTTTAAGASGVTYTLGFTTSSSGTLVGGLSAVTLAAPAGTVFGPCPYGCGGGNPTYFFTDLTNPSASGAGSPQALIDGGSEVSVVPPKTIPAGDSVTLVITMVGNASTVGPATFFVSTSSDAAPTAVPLDLVAPEPVASLTAAVTPGVVGLTDASLSTFFTLSPVGGLAAGSSTITLSGPSGMVFPVSLGDYQVLDARTGSSVGDGSGSAALSGGGSTATIPIPFTTAGGDQLAVTVSGVTNPTSPGTYHLAVRTSSDTVSASTSLSFSTGAALSGTVTQQSNGNDVGGASVQVCPTAGGSCVSTTTASNGSYSFLLSDGAYQVTADASSLSQSSVSVLISGTASTTANLVLGPQEPLPDGATITTAQGTQSVDPGINWAEPSTVNLTGCPNGYGFELLTGVNTATGQLETEAFPLTENPTGSGQYQATIPPLRPIHGDVDWSTALTCLPATALNPNVGDTAGGTQVTINGFGFTGATAVDFGSVPAESFRVISDSTIEAVSPPGTGTVDVTVTSTSGLTPTHPVDEFTYTGVTTLSPTSGPVGTPVMITGTGFDAATSVFFGDQVATEFTVDSNTQITAVAPPGQLGTSDVQVYFPLGATTPTPADEFTYAAVVGGTMQLSSQVTSAASSASSPPLSEQAVERLLANAVVEGGTGSGTSQNSEQLMANAAIANACAGFNGYIKKKTGVGGAVNCGGVGSGDPNAPDANAIAAVECLYYTLVYKASCSGKPSGGGYIDPSGTVQDTYGDPVAGATVTILRSDSAAGPFVAVPSASSDIEPATNPETSDGQGQFGWDVLAGCYQIQAAKSGCADPEDSSQADATTGVLQVPPPQVGLELTLECGPSSPPVPTLVSDSPDQGPLSGGTTVTLTGTGFSGATSVEFGAAGQAPFTVESPTTIVATSPAYDTTGPANVTVETPGGTTGAETFIYLAPPTITSVSPSEGPTGGGTPVTLIGDFGSVAAVTFGSTPAAFVQASPTELFVQTPPGSGSAQIAVTSGCPVGVTATICGATAPSSLSDFTYGTFGLQITSVSPLHLGAVGQSYSDTLAAIGGNPPYRWSISSGKLPKGLHLVKSTGVIKGTPAKRDSGNYAFSIKVVDTKIKTKGHPATQNSATAELSITVSTQ